ncbi:MAG TPA: protease modulator HflC [Planctomycetes bacterium]|nr:protease modulator HflC [Planctomycetota bacterium]
MKNVSVLILVIIISVVLVLCFVSFQVRETETALVTTFGKPTRSISEPGWYWKWPLPIQMVYKFDRRAHLFKGIMEETSTRGGEPIVVTSYIVWSVSDPQEFLEALQDKTGAEDQLKSLLRDTQNSVIGQHYFSEFVNSEPEKIRFKEIEGQMYAALKNRLSEKRYGIDVKAVGIKQLGISEEVTRDVFDRMRADRKRKTEAILAEGNAEATKIKTDAESKRTELLAVVEAQAKSIRGEGDAEAAKYFKLLEVDPDFAMFLRDLEALEKILKEKSTIVLGAEAEPVKLLKGIPDIKPKD